MKNSERCGNCGDMLSFVGWDRRGKRVTTCTRSLTHKEQGRAETTSVPCNPKAFVRAFDYRQNVYSLMDVKAVNWHPRVEERWL